MSVPAGSAGGRKRSDIPTDGQRKTEPIQLFKKTETSSRRCLYIRAAAGALLYVSLFQKAFNDHCLSFLLAHSEGPELHELLVIDPADGSLMDDLRVHVARIDLRDGADLRLVHNDRVTLDMGVASVISDGPGMEHLLGRSFSHGAGHDPCRAVLSV